MSPFVKGALALVMLGVLPGCVTEEDLGVLRMAAKSDVIFVGDFETGDLTGFNTSGNAPTVTTNPVHTGKHAMKTFLDRNTSAVSYRTEVVPKNQDTYVGEEYWYGLSIYLPADYVPDDIWEIVAQWHGRPDFDLGEDWRNPVMALNTTGGKWSLVNRWDAKPNTFASGAKQYDGSKSWDFGPYVKQQWTDWVFHVKWSYQSGGLLEVFKDGKQLVNRSGPNAFNDAKGPYLKMGLYKGWKDPAKQGNVSKRTLYHDELRIAKGPGATFQDVAPPVPASPDLGQPDLGANEGSPATDTETTDLQTVGEDADNNSGDQTGGAGGDAMVDPDGAGDLEGVGERSRGVDGCALVSVPVRVPPPVYLLLLGLLLLLRRSGRSSC